MDSILRLLYTSQARIDLTQAEVEAILQQSRDNNLKAKVTGILCYSRRDFIQVLEGPEKATLKLYTKILEDSRHQQCKLISIDLTEKRIFERWSMGYITVPDSKMQQLRLEMPAKINHDNTDKFVLHLRSFLNNTAPKAVI
ncbi:MAG TPA: BLUF domain-containing protein [Methylophaga sp.]|nr:BLUF domain-containing protein [Methylophaga sp.]